MEDKKIIKNENKKIHILSKKLIDRMACECQNIYEVKETKKTKIEDSILLLSSICFYSPTNIV